MTMACKDKEPRETLRGTGPCRITYETLKRNGKPNWWCRTHGMEAAGPDGGAVDACAGSWFDPVAPEQQLDLDVADGEFAIWGVVPPAIEIEAPAHEPGKIHVHRRATAGSPKDIDRSFDIVRVHDEDRVMVIEGMAAVAFSVSELVGEPIRVLTCPHCGERHIDEARFATHPHTKHLCNSCGRNFRDTTGPSISNPLADAYERLGRSRGPDPVPVDRPLDLDESDFAALQLWPSNRAIVSTMTRPEDDGVHVHAWDSKGRQILDDTFSPVTLQGEVIDVGALRLLSVQRAVDLHARVVAVTCGTCGGAIMDAYGGWIEPSTTHVCAACGKVTKTKRKVFSNPLAPK